MIFLFGFKGCGKSYWGKWLSLKLNLPFIDTDLLIAPSARIIYQTIGEHAFRRIEEQILRSFSIEPKVVALGGGTLLDPINQSLALQLGTLLFLKASWETVEPRLDPKWPHYSERKILFDQRMNIYEKIPAHQVTIDDTTEKQFKDLYGF